MNTKVFMLFADCIPVAGFKKATICDLGREQMILIPKSLYHFIEEFEGANLSELINAVDDDQKEIIHEYVQHLEDRELLFWCDEADTTHFPKIKPRWQSPNIISNAIIEFNPTYTYEETLLELNKLGCSYYQFRLTDLTPNTLDPFSSLLETLCEKCQNLNGFEIIAPHHSQDTDEQFITRMRRYIQLRDITLYSHPSNSQVELNTLIVNYKTRSLTKEHIKSTESTANFFPNYDFFFESKHRSTYYNGKVTIDFEGGIKNIVSDTKLFGNMHTDSLTDVINQPGFQTNWYASKDKVKGCRDCEFRYTCFDTRPLTFNEADQLYESEIQCDYNPYTAEWVN